MEDTKKIRRRIEDHLRKNPREIAKVACLLGIGCDSENNSHKYADHKCPQCGAIFCYSCCGDTNRDQGGKYDPDYMLCPVCGHDIDSK